MGVVLRRLSLVDVCPWYTWAPREFLSDPAVQALIRRWGDQGELAYRRALDLHWVKHGIPEGLEQLADDLGCSEECAAWLLRRFFPIAREGRRWNARMRRIMAQAIDRVPRRAAQKARENRMRGLMGALVRNRGSLSKEDVRSSDEYQRLRRRMSTKPESCSGSSQPPLSRPIRLVRGWVSNLGLQSRLAYRDLDLDI